ncbi:EamA family transporter [Acidianus sulfidivorans JP7]|uniref:EamA family transporter n=1 Tax=Acidianus sulfidivorans JP7 TaxID=619593 RepID=A0A2U9IQD5_9CREN|nr:DMT family transporter [Acidianus sulfidivorans]AWR98240.1 EamA family transporter [Acidianus sulfidivorans JP7]
MRSIYYLIPYVLISSFNYMFAKEAVDSSSPFIFNLIRYLVSALIFFSLGGKLIFNKDVLTLSIFTTTSSVLWAYGLIYVSPAASAVLSYSMPLFSLPLAFLIIKEKPTNIEYIGLTVGFLGVILYSIPLASHIGSLLGALMTIANAVFWAGFTVYYRKMKNYSPYDVNLSQFLIGSLLLTPFSIQNHAITFSSTFMEGIIYTSTLGGAFSFFLWNLLAKSERISKLTVSSFSVPIFSTILQAVENEDLPSMYQISGITVMFIGIMISRLKGGISIIDKRYSNKNKAIGAKL